MPSETMSPSTVADTDTWPAGLHSAIARLQMQYVHAIDNDEVERWPSFFTDDCRYRIVSRRDYDAGRPMGLWYCDSRGMLEDRVKSLRGVNVYEPQHYRHIIGPTEILAPEAGGWKTQTSYMLVRTMHDGEMTLFSAGRYVDRIVYDGVHARLASRTVVTDSWRYDTLIVIPV